MKRYGARRLPARATSSSPITRRSPASTSTTSSSTCPISSRASCSCSRWCARIGSTSAASAPASAPAREVADPWLEGLQLDQLKIYEGGKLNEMLLTGHPRQYPLSRIPRSATCNRRWRRAGWRMRRLDELFDKYGATTMLGAIEHIFAETELKCRRTVSTFPDGVYEAESFLDNDGVSKRAGPYPCQGHRRSGKGRYDDRPFGLLAGAQSRHQLAHSGRRARRLQGADRAARSGQRRLVQRAEAHHPRRQHHDGALPRADGGLEHDHADRRRHHRQGAGAGGERPDSRGPSRHARRVGRVLRPQS